MKPVDKSKRGKGVTQWCPVPDCPGCLKHEDRGWHCVVCRFLMTDTEVERCKAGWYGEAPRTITQAAKYMFEQQKRTVVRVLLGVEPIDRAIDHLNDILSTRATTA